MWVGDCFEDLAEIPGPVHLAIGVFDGLHRGHEAVIQRALQESRRSGGTTAVLTFDPHPVAVLRPESAPPLLTGARQKQALLRAMGVHHLVLLKFSLEFAQMSGSEFVEELVRWCKPLRHICVGHEWTFGRGRSGNIGLLRELGAKHGFVVDAVPSVTEGGRTVSSTEIRQAVAEGRLEDAQAMLGRPYAAFGRVVRGSQMGRALGFPTANVDYENGVLPPQGVYAVRAVLDGVSRLAVANLGRRPTIAASTAPVLEVHIPNFDRDLYGSDFGVEFLRFLRPEQQFADVDALKDQIARDIVNAATTAAGRSTPCLQA